MSTIKEQTALALAELLQSAKLNAGELLVIGCSTSEVVGQRIGTAGSIQAAQEIYEAVLEAVAPLGVSPAFQCCEHLNRALVVPRTCQKAYGLEEVCVVPHPRAGGSLAAHAYRNLDGACVVERIQAHAGIDIGGTMVGMHLKPVAVPVRAPLERIGEAIVLMARTRPKLIGGVRAQYPEE